jgi:rfaE bifunctional protein kinase chain/domain
MQKDVVLVTGNFNVLHPGHIRLIKFAKNFARKVIIGVFSDELAGSAVDVIQDFRLEAVASIGLVDQVLLINTSLSEFILEQKPDVIVKGKEYEDKFNPELEILQAYGGQLIFSSGEIGTISNSGIGETDEIPLSTKNSMASFMSRHSMNSKQLTNIVNNFCKKRICVIGDIIIDQYIDCFALGMSQEEPTLVVSPQEETQFLGGAGIVASHASQLGANVTFLSVTGQDKARNFAASILDKYKVNYSFIVDTARPTTVKQRFRSQGKSLLRVSTLSQQAIPSKLQDIIFSEFEKISNKLDLVIFSDFNYGCLPQALVDKIIKLSKSKNIFIASDSQSSSQLGNIARFKGSDLITPTEREARLSLQNHDDGLVVLADKLMIKAEAKHILLKLGDEGMICQHSKITDGTPHTERLEALNPTPVDVSGAGDSVLTTAALALASEASLLEASLLGSIAAYIQVGRTGNIPIKKEEILKVLS